MAILTIQLIISIIIIPSLSETINCNTSICRDNSSISCQKPNEDCNIICSECQRSTIYCSNSPSSVCNVTCTNRSSCAESIIYCPSNANCIINALKSDSLGNAHINCPSSKSNICSISCHDELSCVHTTFNATDSLKLNIHCHQSYSCLNPIIYCPPFTINNDINTSHPLLLTDSTKNCYISANSPVTTNHYNLQLYAIHSWNDVDLTDYNGGIADNSTSEMHCGVEYNYSCKISTVSWNCIDTTSMCYIGNITDIHTTFPFINGTNGTEAEEEEVISVPKQTDWGLIVGLSIGIGFMVLFIVLFGLWYYNNCNMRNKDNMEGVTSDKANDDADEKQRIITENVEDSLKQDYDDIDDNINVTVDDTNDCYANVCDYTQGNMEEIKKNEKDIDKLWDSNSQENVVSKDAENDLLMNTDND